MNKLPSPEDLNTIVEDQTRALAHARKMRERPRFEDIFMDFAAALSARSTCRRLQVGCVIASLDHRYVYGVGYNGTAAGGPNDCDSEVPGACGCAHAEANAIINCNALRQMEKVVYCTNLPCVMCSKYLINLGGVVRVVYRHDYRIRDGLGWLSRAGISVEHLLLRPAPAQANSVG